MDDEEDAATLEEADPKAQKKQRIVDLLQKQLREQQDQHMMQMKAMMEQMQAMQRTRAADAFPFLALPPASPAPFATRALPPRTPPGSPPRSQQPAAPSGREMTSQSFQATLGAIEQRYDEELESLRVAGRSTQKPKEKKSKKNQAGGETQGDNVVPAETGAAANGASADDVEHEGEEDEKTDAPKFT